MENKKRLEVMLMLSEHNKFLEQAYLVLNRVYFEDSLPEAVITIQSSQHAYGHITVGKVWQDSWDSYHEINISAEYLNRPVENIIATLLEKRSFYFFFTLFGRQNIPRYGKLYEEPSF